MEHDGRQAVGPSGCAASAWSRPPSGSASPGALVAEALSIADGDEVAVVAREELPATVDFWRGHGFVRDRAPVAVPRAAARRPAHPPGSRRRRMRDLGRMVGGLVRAGDLVVLSGELGAGKTTFTQGLGRRPGRVRGDVTSPTFVIARVHPSLSRRPGSRARRRLPSRRHRRARRPRPRRLARRGGHRRRVGHRHRRGPGRRRASRSGSPARPPPPTPTTPTPSTPAPSPSSPSAPAGSGSPGPRNRDSPVT